MTPPLVTEATLRENTDAASFHRGESYYRRGAVVALVYRGDALEAEVQGSDYAPYHVRVGLDARGVTHASCTCPYDWDGWCKHIVAALLTYMHRPEAVEPRPALQQRLSGLAREQLQGLVLDLAVRDAEIAAWIEVQIDLLEALPSTSAPAGGPPAARVDTRNLRRHVHAALHSLDRMRASEAYRHVGGVVNEVRQLLRPAQDLIAAGDGRNALAVLEAVTDAYLEDWTALDDSDGEASALFGELGPLWTEALVSTELSAAERGEWAEKLSAWQAQLDAYGLDDVLAAAQAAAQQGWDDPRLQGVLRGEESATAPWDQAPWYIEELTLARLKVLEQHGRHEEYLRLARAAGAIVHYLTALVRQGQTRQAVNEGLRLLHSASEALQLAQALRERGDGAAALDIGLHGLALDGAKGALAGWVRDLASALGDVERALSAGLIAFRETPSLDAYLKVQALAAEGWPQHRAELLEHLRRTRSYLTQAQVDVFLHEGLLDDAIAAVAEGAGRTQLARVMDAALGHRPEWVIEAARKQAEAVMETGASGAYGDAVAWLRKAQAAYAAAGRREDWQAYLDELRIRHRRKYKLMTLLKAL